MSCCQLVKLVWKVANDDDDITTEVGSEFHSIMVEGKKLWRYALILDCGTTNFLLFLLLSYRE